MARNVKFLVGLLISTIVTAQTAAAATAAAVCECSPREFVVSPCSGAADVVCKPLSVCTDEEYELLRDKPRGVEEDRLCQSISSPCDFPLEYEVQPPSPTSDRVCREVRACSNGTETAPPTPTSDRYCYHEPIYMSISNSPRESVDPNTLLKDVSNMFADVHELNISGVSLSVYNATDRFVLRFEGSDDRVLSRIASLRSFAVYHSTHLGRVVTWGELGDLSHAAPTLTASENNTYSHDKNQQAKSLIISLLFMVVIALSLVACQRRQPDDAVTAKRNFIQSQLPPSRVYHYSLRNPTTLVSIKEEDDC